MTFAAFECHNCIELYSQICRPDNESGDSHDKPYFAYGASLRTQKRMANIKIPTQQDNITMYHSVWRFRYHLTIILVIYNYDGDRYSARVVTIVVNRRSMELNSSCKCQILLQRDYQYLIFHIICIPIFLHNEHQF